MYFYTLIAAAIILIIYFVFFDAKKESPKKTTAFVQEKDTIADDGYRGDTTKEEYKTLEDLDNLPPLKAAKFIRKNMYGTGDDFDYDNYGKLCAVVETLEEEDDTILTVMEKANPYNIVFWFDKWKHTHKSVFFSNNVFKMVKKRLNEIDCTSYSGEQIYKLFRTCRTNKIFINDDVFDQMLQTIYRWQEDFVKPEVLGRPPGFVPKFLANTKSGFEVNGFVVWPKSLDCVADAFEVFDNSEEYASLKKQKQRNHVWISKNKGREEKKVQILERQKENNDIDAEINALKSKLFSDCMEL